MVTQTMVFRLEHSSYNYLTESKLLKNPEFCFAPLKNNIYYMTVCTAVQVLFISSVSVEG